MNPQIADNDNLLLDEVEAKLEEICGNLRENDLAFFIVRCFALFFCLVGIIIILVNICKGKGIYILVFSTHSDRVVKDQSMALA